MDDNQLLAHYEQLVERCYRDVEKYIRRRQGTSDEAEEAFREAITAYFVKLENGAIIHNPEGFVFQSAWHAYLRMRHHAGREIPTDPNPGNTEDGYALDDSFEGSAASDGQTMMWQSQPPAPDDIAHQNQLIAAAAEEVQKLRPLHREVIELSFQSAGQSLEDTEIAGILNITVGTMRVRRTEAMKDLRIRLSHRGFGYFNGQGKFTAL